MRRLVGYVRVGPRERVSRRPGLGRQREVIEDRCREEGWTLVAVHEDVRSGRSLRRPGLQAALDTCRQENAGIIVAALDRFTYSVEHLARLAGDLRHGGIALISLEPAFDTATERGALVLDVLAEAATWTPRNLVGRARSATAGAAPGRPPSIPEDLGDRIRAMRGQGATLQAICDVLNGERVPTPRGGSHWRPTSLRAVLRSAT